MDGVKKRIAVSKLDEIIFKIEHSNIEEKGVAEIKKLIKQAGYSKKQIQQFLSMFTKAYCLFAEESPELLSAAIVSIGNMEREENVHLEQLIVLPGEDREKSVIEYIELANISIKI
jgi:hypothetical protein